MALCTDWVDAADVELCSGADLPAGLLARAVTAASELLYAASGRQFTGLCEDVIRPCPCKCGTALCGCRRLAAVALPNTPVVDVIEVLVDGVALAGDYATLVDDRWLVRTEPDRWPTRQRLGLPATEPDTWQVTYSYGTAIPVSGQMAAEVLACELAKGWDGQDCKLPRRLVSMTAEGTTMQFAQVDAQEFFAQGRLGLYEVDSFVSTFNPHRLQRRARLISPRDARCAPRRVRALSAAVLNAYDGGTPFSVEADTYDGGGPLSIEADTYSGGTP